MRAAGLLALVAVTVAGCGQARDTRPSAAEIARDWVPPSEARAVHGGTLYVTGGCVACHSTDGTTGAGPTFLGLAGSRITTTSKRRVRVTTSYLVHAIGRHRPALPQKLSAPEVRALAEFITMIGPEAPGATP